MLLSMVMRLGMRTANITIVLKSQWLACALIFLFSSTALAHKPSDSYLRLELRDTHIDGQWDIALRDIDYAIGIDSNQDNQIDWGELRAHHTAIAAYALAHLHLQSNGRECSTTAVKHLVDNHSDGAYAVLRFRADCSATITTLQIDYRLFFDLDPQHKGLLYLASGSDTRSAVLGSDVPQQTFDLTRPGSLATMWQYLQLGIWHIWTGFDHLLFLFSLLLPAVLTRQSGQWRAAPSLRVSLWDVARVVTAFTLAHSVTLSLAAFDVVSIPSRLVESTIAASVVVAACNNLYPIVLKRRWVLAFCFGLIHGFGFASVLHDLGLKSGNLITSLVSFNLGVECGQLVLVSLFIPLVWRIRGSRFYRWPVMTGGSLGITCLALLWFCERAFLIKLL